MPENRGLTWRLWPCPDILGCGEGLMARVPGDSGRPSVTHGQELSISIREALRKPRRAEESQECAGRKQVTANEPSEAVCVCGGAGGWH